MYTQEKDYIFAFFPFIITFRRENERKKLIIAQLLILILIYTLLHVIILIKEKNLSLIVSDKLVYIYIEKLILISLY